MPASNTSTWPMRRGDGPDTLAVAASGRKGTDISPQSLRLDGTRLPPTNLSHDQGPRRSLHDTSAIWPPRGPLCQHAAPPENASRNVASQSQQKRRQSRRRKQAAPETLESEPCTEERPARRPPQEPHHPCTAPHCNAHHYQQRRRQSRRSTQQASQELTSEPHTDPRKLRPPQGATTNKGA